MRIQLYKWKDLPGFDLQYEINLQGEVRRKAQTITTNGRQIRLKQKYVCSRKNSKGYYYVQLRKDRREYSTNVHRLLAIAFIDNPNNYKLVNHIDGNKTNNDISNLEWCTNSQNMKHAFQNGLANADHLCRKVKNECTGEVYPSIKQAAISLNQSYGITYRKLYKEDEGSCLKLAA